MTHNSVKLLKNDIIYVEKKGQQTAESMLRLHAEINTYIEQLRKDDKPVLILSNAAEDNMDDPGAQAVAKRLGKEMDFDQSATYGHSPYLVELRRHMMEAANLGDKIGDFHTREEAEAWLQA